MVYLLTFIEGIITFLSPCILPMIPIYFVYLAGDNSKNSSKILINSLGFIVGFTIVFVVIGAFFSFVGNLASNEWIHILSGVIVILFGLSYMEILKFKFLQFPKLKIKLDTSNMNFFKSILFGFVFSLAWTPCLSTFLGSAVATSMSSGGKFSGIVLLLCYSLGLAIPFLLSALLMKELTNVFKFIKQHYKIINNFSGLFLIIVGILIITKVL